MINSSLLRPYHDLFVESREKILADFFTFLRFQTISSESAFQPELQKCAHWLHEYLSSSGFNVELWETGSHPIVFAEWLGAGPEQPTVLIYNHYDVQPVDPLPLWQSPPFEPTVRNGQVYARGAQDNKGQCFYVISSLASQLKTTGKLPVNVKLCIEGEEECGSAGLSALLGPKQDRLRADHLLIVDLGLPGPETPAICLGTRGIVVMTVDVQGAAVDLHSGSHGGVVYNPNHALIEVLAKLRDGHGRITIPGFYDQVEDFNVKDLSRLHLHFDVERYEQKFGTKAVGGERSFTPIQSAWLRPTLEINGISGGYAGNGFKTVIPAQACGKISCRLVPNQEPEKIGNLVADYISSIAPKGCSVSVRIHPGGGKPLRTRMDSQVVQAVSQAYQELFQKPCEYTLEGASIPIVAELARTCKAEVVLMGFALDSDNMHAPNEHFGLDRLEKGFVVMPRILDILRA